MTHKIFGVDYKASFPKAKLLSKSELFSLGWLLFFFFLCLRNLFLPLKRDEGSVKFAALKGCSHPKLPQHIFSQGTHDSSSNPQEAQL